MQAERLAVCLTLLIVGINTKPSSVKSSRSLGTAQDVPEEETRALVLILSALGTRLSDIKELTLAIASIQALVAVWAFVTDQEVDLGHAVVAVTCERSALSRREKVEIILADLPEGVAKRVGAGLEVSDTVIAVNSGERLWGAGEQCDHDGKGWEIHGG